MLSLIILVASMVASYTFVFPSLQGRNIESTKDLLDAFISVGKVLVIVAIGLLIAAVVDRFFGTLPMGGLGQSVLLLVALIFCFYGAELVLCPRAEVGEVIFLRGLYPLILVFAFKGSILHYTGMSQGMFLVGAGIYLVGLSVLWLLSYWPNVQRGLADPVGVLILFLLFFLKKYLDTGEMVDINSPDFLVGYSPVIFYLGPVFFLTLVSWKFKEDWRQTWTHRLVIAGHIGWLLYALPYMILLVTGDISPEIISHVVAYNQSENQIARIKIAQAYQVLGSLQADIAKAEKIIRSGKKVSGLNAKILKKAHDNIRKVNELEIEIWRHRHHRVLRPWAMVGGKIKGAWEQVPSVYKFLKKEVMQVFRELAS